MTFQKKANLAVRLFLSLVIPSLLPIEAADPKAEIPPTWGASAKLDRGGWVRAQPTPAHEKELVARIYARLKDAHERQKAPNDYTETIPLTEAKFDLIALPEGTFRMGSPNQEEGRNADEPDWRDVAVSAFWIGKHEVTWAEFAPFAMPSEKDKLARNFNGSPRDPGEATRWIDWISAPTLVYASPDMGMGLEDDYPAVGMTQHAANKYCQWVSWQTGRYYRLPTEAEWEYACRAGTTGPFHCPVEELQDYAVFDPDMKRDRYEKVGTKKPNPWGIYDMHGNVQEWCLDGYSSTAYGILPKKDPWFRATQRYPRIARGGSFYDGDPKHLRSAHRGYSHPNWNMQDPQLPQSIWWLADAMWQGFRVVRPVNLPSEEEVYEAWNTGAMHYEGTEVIPEAR